jgi:hypothetical protein
MSRVEHAGQFAWGLQSLPTLISRSILLTLVLLVVCVEEPDGVGFASG